jgi:hypothetical protein
MCGQPLDVASTERLGTGSPLWRFDLRKTRSTEVSDEIPTRLRVARQEARRYTTNAASLGIFDRIHRHERHEFRCVMI